jgi:adenylylsulfate kinase
VSCGIITINCFVSPTIKIRELAKSIIGPEDFIEIYINSPLEVCESRDVKGLYKKARSGQIPDFTGVNSEFEPPDDPALEVNSSELSIQESLSLLTEYFLPIVSVR